MRSIVEEEIPIYGLPVSLLHSQVFGAGSATAHLAPRFAGDALRCSLDDVPHAERDVAGGVDLDFVGPIVIESLHHLIPRPGNAGKVDAWDDVVPEAR